MPLFPFLSRRSVLGGLAASVAVAALLPAPVLAQDAPDVADMTLGDVNAPVKVVEYASYTCPHCAAFHADAFKRLKSDYIDTGKVHFTLREVYFDRYGLWAAMIARCGGEMRYFFVHDRLFETQADWAAQAEATAVIDSLKAIGRAAGLEDAAMEACLQDEAMAKALVARFETNMAADGVEGTPTIFINGAKHSNMSYDDLKVLIEAELAS
jgi:protein-disulfide isomerase